MNLNEIDFKKLHLQSKGIQIGAMLILAVTLVALGYFAFFQGQWDEYQQAVEQEDKLKSEYSTKAIQAANLENLQKELVLIEASTSKLLKQLPTDPEIPSLIQELHQAAAKNGLTMNSVVPQNSVKENPIERLPFAISVSGEYEQLAGFMRDVGKMSRIVTLANVNLVGSNDPKAAKDSKSKLTLTALANTYKAMDLVSEASGAAAASAESSAQK